MLNIIFIFGIDVIFVYYAHQIIASFYMAKMPEYTERVERIWGKRNVYKVLVLKPERQRTIGRP